MEEAMPNMLDPTVRLVAGNSRGLATCAEPVYPYIQPQGVLRSGLISSLVQVRGLDIWGSRASTSRVTSVANLAAF